MATSTTWRLLVAAAVALQGPAEGLTVDLAAVEQLRIRLEAVDAENASHVAELARALAGDRAGRPRPEERSPPARGEAKPAMMDRLMMRWLDEAFRASEDLEEEDGAGEQDEGDLMDAAPGPEEDAAPPIQLSRVHGRQADDELLPWDTKPDTKERKRYRKAPRASKRKRRKLAEKFAQWLNGAVAMESAVDDESDNFLQEIINITEEAEAKALSPEQAEKELKEIQHIWDKYELDNENVTAIDIVEKLYPSNDTWYEDSKHRLHTMNENQSHVIREEVESLKAELERVRNEAAKMRVEKLKAEVARLQAERALLDSSAKLDAAGGNASVLRRELRQSENQSAPLPVVLERDEQDGEAASAALDELPFVPTIPAEAVKQTDQARSAELDASVLPVVPTIPTEAMSQTDQAPSAELDTGASVLPVVPTVPTEAVDQTDHAPSAELDEGASAVPYVPAKADTQADEAPSAEPDREASGALAAPAADGQAGQAPNAELDEEASYLPVVPNPGEEADNAPALAEAEGQGQTGDAQADNTSAPAEAGGQGQTGDAR